MTTARQAAREVEITTVGIPKRAYCEDACSQFYEHIMELTDAMINLYRDIVCSIIFYVFPLKLKVYVSVSKYVLAYVSSCVPHFFFSRTQHSATLASWGTETFLHITDIHNIAYFCHRDMLHYLVFIWKTRVNHQLTGAYLPTPVDSQRQPNVA